MVYQFDRQTRLGTGRFIRRKWKLLALIGGKLTAKKSWMQFKVHTPKLNA